MCFSLFHDETTTAYDYDSTICLVKHHFLKFIKFKLA